MNELQHQSDLKGKHWDDREILHGVKFMPDGTFGAISSAEVYLKDLEYAVGSMEGSNPIGFLYEAASISKWGNLSEDDRLRLDGVIIPDPEFREGGALILFFTPPRY